MRVGTPLILTVIVLLGTAPNAHGQVSTSSDSRSCAGMFEANSAPPLLQTPAYRVGDSWAYKNYQTKRRGTVNRTWTETVTALDEKGAQTQRVDRLPSETQNRAPYSSRLEFGETGFNFPLSVGKHWKSDIVRKGVRVGESERAVRSCEIIRTDAGEFATLKMSNDFQIDSTTYHQVMWFAPSARNIVRLVYLEKGEAVQTTELTSFSLR